MATRAHSDIKTSQKTASSLLENYPDSLGEVFAVVIAHFEIQRSISGSLNDDFGEEIFRECTTTATSLMATRGGSNIQSSGHAIQGCFNDAKDAVKAAIAIQHMIEALNNKKQFQGRLHAKTGIDFGEVMRGMHDIHGPAADIARLLKNIASPDEICISSQVFNLSREIPSVHFELAQTWNKKNVPEGLEVYRIVWDAVHATGATTHPILYFRPVWRLWDQAFVGAWDDLLKEQDTLLGEEQGNKLVLNDKSIVVMPKHIESAITLSLSVTGFLRKRLENPSDGPIPIQIIADIVSCGRDWKPDAENIPPMWATLNPGFLYISENAFDRIQEKTEIPGNPIHRFYGDQSFFQIALDNELPLQGIKQFVYQKALVQGSFLPPCFYCGDKKHQSVNCPSKNIPETTHALDSLGYLSVDELNRIFYRYIMGEDGNDNDQQKVNLLTEGSLGLAASGFFELKRVFQLRFFRTFWNTTHEEWNKVRKNNNQGQGGLIWLAQDSLRVGELAKAESILTSAVDRYPLDYRVYVASGFLNVDKNNLSKADYYFTEAFSVAKTDVQKVYALLLLSRLYWITGNETKAYEKIQRALSLNVESVDVNYQDIVFKFYQRKEKFACQRLSRLVQEDRAYYVTALIDPDLAPFSHAVGETLGALLDRTRKEAQSAVTDANNEYNLSRIALERNADNNIQLLRTEIDQLIDKDSYFGYLDIIEHCNAIISTCRNSTIRRKREIWEIFQELNKRLQANLKFIQAYPFKGMVKSCREQLAHALDRIHYVQNIGPALSQEQLIACHKLRDELTEEWSGLESHLKQLDYLLKLCKGLLRFLRWSGIFMAVVWFFDLCIFPLIVYYLNAFLSGFDISTIPNVWLYQKNFLLFGSLVGMSASLFITIRSFFKK